MDDASPATQSPTLSIIVPFFNEQCTLLQVMKNLQGACPDAQHVYVDDGSTDGSLEIAQAHARTNDSVVTGQHAGKGSAIRRGIPLALGTYTIIQDADLEYDPQDIDRLLQQALAEHCDAVFGSRRLVGMSKFAYLSYYIGGVALTWAFNILFRQHLTDQPTCYKLVRTSLLQSLKLHEDDFRFDPELCCQLALRGVDIHEVAISYSPRTKAEGKKIRWIDGVRHLWCFLQQRLKRSN